MLGFGTKQIAFIIDTKTLFLSPLTLSVHYFFFPDIEERLKMEVKQACLQFLHVLY